MHRALSPAIELPANEVKILIETGTDDNIETQAKISLFYLEGNLGIESVAKLRDELISLMTRSPQIILNLSRLESVDIPIIQLLLAAFREAKERRIGLHLTGKVSERLCEQLVVCGICRRPPDSAKQLEQQIKHGFTA